MLGGREERRRQRRCCGPLAAVSGLPACLLAASQPASPVASTAPLPRLLPTTARSRMPCALTCSHPPHRRSPPRPQVAELKAAVSGALGRFTSGEIDAEQLVAFLSAMGVELRGR